MHFIWLTDKDGRALYFNKAWYDITGRSKENSLGEGWAKALHPDDVGRVFTGWRELPSKDGLFTSTGRFLIKDGSYRRYQILGIPAGSESEEIVNWVGIDAESASVKNSAPLSTDGDRLPHDNKQNH